MTTLIILRGLPASGKTVAAREWVAQDPTNRARVGRDHLRDALYGTRKGLKAAQETTITQVQREAVRTLLKASKDVIVDDLNLKLKYARAWADLAMQEGVEFEVIDATTPVDECVKRDAKRPERERVGESVIRDLNKRFQKRPEVKPSERLQKAICEPYEGTPGKPDAWIFDLDGTLAKNNSGRSFYDMTRVHEDDPHAAVVAAAKAFYNAGYQILAVSGRTDEAEIATAEWLNQHLGHDEWTELLMRRAGDQRSDAVVKAEIFDNHIRPHYNVIGTVDDRDAVVDFWRSIGLTCLQAAPGNF